MFDAAFLVTSAIFWAQDKCLSLCTLFIFNLLRVLKFVLTLKHKTVEQQVTTPCRHKSTVH